MKIVVVESQEASGGSVAVTVLEQDIWAFEVLCARAGQRVITIADQKEAIDAVETRLVRSESV